MSIVENLKADAASDVKLMEEKLSTSVGRKWLKYGLYGLLGLVILTLSFCALKSCTSMGPQEHKAFINENYVQPRVQQATPVQYEQPASVVVQQGGSGIRTAVAAGTLGYMVGQHRAIAASPTTIIHRTVIIRRNTPVCSGRR